MSSNRFYEVNGPYSYRSNSKKFQYFTLRHVCAEAILRYGFDWNMLSKPQLVVILEEASTIQCEFCHTRITHASVCCVCNKKGCYKCMIVLPNDTLVCLIDASGDNS